MKKIKRNILYIKEGVDTHFRDLAYQAMFFGDHGLNQTYSSYILGLDAFIGKLYSVVEQNINGSLDIKNENLPKKDQEKIKDSLEKKFSNKKISWI
jgi:hypothetical protein